MTKNRVKRGDFSKVSTGEIPVSTGPVDFLNRSGPVRFRFQLWAPLIDSLLYEESVSVAFFLIAYR